MKKMLIFNITENVLNCYSYCPKGQTKDVFLFDASVRGICKYALIKPSNENHIASPKYWNVDSRFGIGMDSSSVNSLIGL